MPPKRVSRKEVVGAPKLYYNERTAEHAHIEEKFTVEKSSRAVHVYEHLAKCGLLERCQVLSGRMATDAELLTVHTKRHVQEVRQLTSRAAADPTNRAVREPDGPGGVYYSPHAEMAAKLACGCVIDASLGVLRERASQPPDAPADRRPLAFAIVRPPGHHAGADDTPGHRAEGFCFYNSVAVAAGCALEEGASKICILDWDVHHGNGTQNLFYREGRVLYISLHRFGNRWYPETGDLDEVGEDGGKGTNVNIPWPDNGLSDTDYFAAFNLVLLPILRSFGPELLLISAGFDAADGDAQGKMKVSPAGFAHMTSMLLSTVDCPVVAALEGGYNPLVTSQCCEAVLRVLLGEPAPPEPPKQLLSRCCEPTLRAVIDAQKAYWPVLRDGRKGRLDGFFADAAASGQPPRVSKRKSAGSAPTRQYEEEPDPCHLRASPTAASVARSEAEAAAAKAASELEDAEAAQRKASRRVEAAEQALAREQHSLAESDAALEAAREAHLAALEAAASAAAAGSDGTSEKDDTNGTTNPQGTCLWSNKVRCEVGRRVFAQYGEDEEELWFRATITGVTRDDIGQWCDVQYDDGDIENKKAIKRVRAIDSSDSESDSEDENEDDEDEDEEAADTLSGMASSGSRGGKARGRGARRTVRGRG